MRQQTDDCFAEFFFSSQSWKEVVGVEASSTRMSFFVDVLVSRILKESVVR